MESFKLLLNSITPISNQEFENYSQSFKSYSLPKIAILQFKIIMLCFNIIFNTFTFIKVHLLTAVKLIKDTKGLQGKSL